MDLTNETKNPFLRDLLQSAACTVLLFLLFAFLYRASGTWQQLYRLSSLAGLGGSAVYLSKSLLDYFRFAAFARRREGRRADLASYLDDRRVRQASPNDPLQIGVSILLLSVLLLLLPLGGRAAARLLGGVSAGELAGRYELTEIRGTDESSVAFSMMRGMGAKLTLEIDGAGNGTLRSGTMDFGFYRFDVRKMTLLELKDGQETGRGSTFTWRNGTLTINNSLVFQKTGDGK